MYDKERYAALRSWLRDWDFELIPHMIINKTDRDIILMLMDRWEHEKEQKREYTKNKRLEAYIKRGNE